MAGRGVAGEAIGRRFGLDEEITGKVIASGTGLITGHDHRLETTHELMDDTYAGGAAPLAWRGRAKGALWAATTDPARQFGEAELAALERLAGLGSAVLDRGEENQQLEQSVESSVEAMAYAIDMRDKYTSEHSDEVVGLALAVGERLGLDRDAMGELRFGARLHDLGKIAVPDSILHKPGSLDPNEWEVMKRHSVIGAQTLERVVGLEGVARVVRAGHERWDGDGYPDGLHADEIPLASRIVFACDAYHAMTSDRPYRKALRRWTAVNELRDCAGSQFDPEIVETLVHVLKERAAST